MFDINYSLKSQFEKLVRDNSNFTTQVASYMKAVKYLPGLFVTLVIMTVEAVVGLSP